MIENGERKRERKENEGMNENFYLNSKPTILFPSKLKRKEERKWHWEKGTKLYAHFHLSTFNI